MLLSWQRSMPVFRSSGHTGLQVQLLKQDAAVKQAKPIPQPRSMIASPAPPRPEAYPRVQQGSAAHRTAAPFKLASPQSAMHRTKNRQSRTGRRDVAKADDGKEGQTAPKPVRAARRTHGKASSTSFSASARKVRESRVRNRLERYKYYPASARRRGIEGEVELDFALNGKGEAHSVSIVASSGYNILDSAALRTVRRAQPFPVAGGRYHFRLRFSRL